MIRRLTYAIRRSFWLRRIASSLLVLFLASALVFFILRIIPGDPTTIRAARPGVDAEAIAILRRQLRLDEPIWSQYLAWLAGVVRGDFGTSFFSEYSTTDLIAQAIGPSFQLALASILIATVLAVALATAAARWPNGVFTYINRAVMTFGLSLPSFVIGILLIIVFAQDLRWLPTRGYESPIVDFGDFLYHLTLPALTMGIALAAPILRMLQSSLMEVMGSEYIRTAVSMGLSRGEITFRHGLRNAFVPTLVFIGVTMGHLLGGVVIVEYVFGWPGLGTLAVQAVFNRDYPVLQGVVLFAAVVFTVVSLVTDALTRWLDPRTKEGT